MNNAYAMCEEVEMMAARLCHFYSPAASAPKPISLLTPKQQKQFKRLDRQRLRNEEQLMKLYHRMENYLSEDKSRMQLKKFPKSMTTLAERTDAELGLVIISTDDAMSDVSSDSTVEEEVESATQNLSSLNKDDMVNNGSFSTTCSSPISDHNLQETVELWVPSELALHANEPDPPSTVERPTRVTLQVITSPVFVKSKGFDEKAAAIRSQGSHCKGCLAPLKKEFSPARMSMALDGALFCYYTGYYFCTNCNPGTTTMPIPSRILRNWDFTEMSVSYKAADFLTLHEDEPLLCVSSANPSLYDNVSLLRNTRQVRLQLVILNKIGISCEKFRDIFYGIPSRRARDARTHKIDDKTFIPTWKRYLVHDTEFWSLKDLLTIHEHQPLPDSHLASSGKQITPHDCPLTRYLLDLRGMMIRHIVKSCPKCYKAAANVCPVCKRKDPENLVFAFNVLEVRTCSRCGTPFHKDCWGHMQMKSKGCICCRVKQEEEQLSTKKTEKKSDC